jgi:hypothetical protein
MINQDPKPNCPACGEGYLLPRQMFERVTHNGVEGSITLYYSECNHCGSELAGKEESNRNKVSMLIFKAIAES